MDTQSARVGLIEVTAPCPVTASEVRIEAEFGLGQTDLWLELNGRRFSAPDLLALVDAIRESCEADRTRLLSIPFSAELDGSRVIIHHDLPVNGSVLTGAAAQAAADKATTVARSSHHSWPAALDDLPDVLDLELLTGEEAWDGPLVVSMPRTGSTLMGMLFLFAADESAESGFRFDRYVHEPVAPVYWRGDELEQVGKFLIAPLGSRDVVQESAYQFADPRVAEWFMGQARQPIVFTMRHPQIAWPSRWRAMLAQKLDEDPNGPLADMARHALEGNDFAGLGSFLADDVHPADNGFYAFISLVDVCIREGIDFVIVDNTRFRSHPEATMRALCRRLGVDYSPAMTEWSDLQDALPRVVMSDLALGDEYEWYYSRTLSSDTGIRPETTPPLDSASFPDVLRGTSEDHLTIDEAVTWYHLLLARPETLP